MTSPGQSSAGKQIVHVNLSNDSSEVRHSSKTVHMYQKCVTARYHQHSQTLAIYPLCASGVLSGIHCSHTLPPFFYPMTASIFSPSPPFRFSRWAVQLLGEPPLPRCCSTLEQFTDFMNEGRFSSKQQRQAVERALAAERWGRCVAIALTDREKQECLLSQQDAMNSLSFPTKYSQTCIRNMQIYNIMHVFDYGCIAYKTPIV